MCGICGELRFDGAPVNPWALEAMRDRIFDPYVTSKDDGDGLGLAIATQFFARLVDVQRQRPAQQRFEL